MKISTSRIEFKALLIWQGMATNRHLVAINRLVFWWYYRRIPEFYRQWTILASIRVFAGGYSQIEREWQSEARRADRYFNQVVQLERGKAA